MSSKTETQHRLERVHWAREVEELEVEDGELVTTGSRSEGEVKAEDTITCTCGREFDAENTERIMEHIATARDAEAMAR